jgi:hypothetical protein
MELKSGFSVGVAHLLRLSVTSAEYFCRRHGSPGGGSQVLRGRWVRWSKFLSSGSKFFGVGGYAVPISSGHKFFGVVGCAGPMVGYQNRRVSVYAKMQIRKCVLLRPFSIVVKNDGNSKKPPFLTTPFFTKQFTIVVKNGEKGRIVRNGFLLLKICGKKRARFLLRILP